MHHRLIHTSKNGRLHNRQLFHDMFTGGFSHMDKESKQIWRLFIIVYFIEQENISNLNQMLQITYTFITRIFFSVNLNW